MFERVLVAIDDSPSTPSTLDHVIALARRGGAAVHVLLVNPLLPAGRGYASMVDTDATALVARAVTDLRTAGVDATGSVVTACTDLAEAIVVVARNRGCDVIVLGSRRRRGIRRLFGHGVRERVVSQSALPVLTAPAPLQLSGHGRFAPERELALLRRETASVA